MSKVLFVIPPCFISSNLDFEIGLPVHLALLGKVAANEGWAVDYLDMTLEEKEGWDSFSKLGTLLDDGEIKVVGISNHTVRTSVTTMAVAERIKTVRPDVKTLVGGVNSTFMWRELLESCPDIDYVLRGYGQPGLRALFRCLVQGAALSAPGLAFRSLGDFHVDQMPPVAPEDFATPSLGGLPVSRYLQWTRTYPLLTQTGCGFSCNFCTSVMPGPYQNREVYREPADVVEEMLQALDIGFERFYISDNVFTSNRRRCLNLCEAFQRAGIAERATWVCMTRVEFVDQGILKAMKRGGCSNIAFGVEAAGASQWKSLQKGRFSEDTIESAFRLTRDAGIDTTAFVLLGAPFQTVNDLDATADLLRILDPDYRVVSFFQPFPGTSYWNAPETFGLSEIVPLEDWNFYEGPICRTTHLSKADLENAAIRLHLESSVTGPMDPKERAITARDMTFATSAELPPAFQAALRSADSGLPISDALERVRQEYGTNGRLIALYWLSAAIRGGQVNLVPRATKREVQDHEWRPGFQRYQRRDGANRPARRAPGEFHEAQGM